MTYAVNCIWYMKQKIIVMNNINILLIDTRSENENKIWIEPENKNKVWIGITRYNSIAVGIVRGDGVVWDGDTISNDYDTPAFIKAWYVGHLFAEVLNTNIEISEELLLSTCISEVHERKINWDTIRVQNLEGVMPTFREVAEKVAAQTPPQEYIEKALEICANHKVTINFKKTKKYLQENGFYSETAEYYLLLCE